MTVLEEQYIASAKAMTVDLFATLAKVQTLSTSIKEVEPSFRKLQAILAYAQGIKSDGLSAFDSDSVGNRNSQLLSVFSGQVSSELTSLVSSVSSMMKEEFTADELKDSLHHLDRVVSFVIYYKGLVDALFEAHSSAVDQSATLHKQVIEWMVLCEDTEAVDALRKYRDIAVYEDGGLGESLQTASAEYQVLTAQLQTADTEYKNSFGWAIWVLSSWAVYSQTLTKVLQQLDHKVVGEAFANARLIQVCTGMLDKATPDQAIQLKVLINKAQQCQSQFSSIVDKVSSGKSEREALYEEDVETGELGESFRSVLISLLTIDIVEKIEKEIKASYGSLDEFLSILKKIGWKATTD